MPFKEIPFYNTCLLDIDLDTPVSSLDISIRIIGEPRTKALYLSYDECQQLFDDDGRLVDHDDLLVLINTHIAPQYLAPPDLQLWTDPDISIDGQPLMESSLTLALYTARNNMHAGVEIMLSKVLSHSW
jgi:hypothetical protein